MLSTLKHQNILSLVFHTQNKTHQYIFLEYCNGGDVARAIQVATQSSLKNNKVRGLIERVVRRITLHTVNALEYVHKFGIVHRDVKSQNVVFSLDYSDPSVKRLIVNQRGEYSEPIKYFSKLKSAQFKLADFGFAKHLDQNGTVSGYYGTLTHMAPEILKGKDYSQEVDIWSLGIMIYEMVCGYVPF